MRRTIPLRGRTVSYELERKHVKNINLRVHPDGSVAVSASPRVPLAVIESFLLRRQDWILAALDRFAKAEERRPPALRYAEGESLFVWGVETPLHVTQGAENNLRYADGSLYFTVKDPADAEIRRRLAENWQRWECERVITELCHRVYPAFQARGVAFPGLSFRRMKSRWGSCRPQKGTLSFNVRLCELPVGCAEYVVVHEFAHFLQPNHSPAFYAEVERVLPDWAERRALLRTWQG